MPNNRLIYRNTPAYGFLHTSLILSNNWCVFIWYQRWESNPLTIRAMRIVLRSIHNWFTLFRTSPTVYLGTTFPCRLLLYHIETHSAGIEPAHLSNSPGCKSATSARPSIWVCFYMVDTSFEDGPLVDHYHLLHWCTYYCLPQGLVHYLGDSYWIM